MFNTTALLLQNPPVYHISISYGSGGSASLSTTEARAGETVYIYISPNSGYELSSVTASGVSLSGSGNTRSFKMPKNDVSVSVTFKSSTAQFTATWNTEYAYSYTAILRDETSNTEITRTAVKNGSLTATLTVGHIYKLSAGEWLEGYSFNPTSAVTSVSSSKNNCYVMWTQASGTTTKLTIELSSSM